MPTSGKGVPGFGPRARLVALTTAGYLLAVGAAWFVVTSGITGIVEEIERDALRADLNRAEGALYSRVRQVRSTAAELAHLGVGPGETPADRDERLLLLDPSHTIRWSAGTPAIPPEALAAGIAPALAAHPEGTVSGLLSLPDGSVLVGSAPSADGMVIVARPLDVEISEISAASGLSIDLAPSGANVSAFEIRGEDLARGSRVVTGLDGTPAAVVRVTSPRTLHANASRMARAVVLVFASLAALFSAVVAVLADRLFASALRQREGELLRSRVVEHSSDGILLVTADTLRVTQANPAARTLLPGAAFGLSLAELLGLPGDTLAARLAELDPVNQIALGEVGVETHDGRRVIEINAWRLDHPTRPLFAVSLRDVTERRLADARARSLALRDPLTGLPNRTAFLEELARSLGEASVSGRVLAVLFLDLDGFKEVNDVLGHDAADALLVEVAQRLQACVRSVDVVARHGGDEFLVLLPDLPSAGAASRTARRLLDAISAPYGFDGQPVRVGASIGVACAPDDGTDASTLIERADLAMYKAKEMGRGGWQPFEAGLLDRARRAIALRRALTGMAGADALVPVYLPQLDVETGEVVAVQAAARWRSEQGSDEHEAILAFAEQAGLATSLTDWLLNRATADLSRLGDSGLRVTIPVVGRPDMEELAERIQAAIAANLIPAHRLELELTDELWQRDPARTRAVLEDLARAGVGLTLGRFGTSHGTFLGLRHLPVQRVKLDKGIVEGAGIEPSSAALLAQLVRGARALGLTVTAAGVDTVGQLALVRRLGCDRVQGLQAGYSQGTPTAGESTREWVRSSGTA